MVPKETTGHESSETLLKVGIHFPHSYQLTLDGDSVGLIYSRPKPKFREVVIADPNQGDMLVTDGYKTYPSHKGGSMVVRELFAVHPDLAKN